MRYMGRVEGEMPSRNPFDPQGDYGADWVRVRVVDQAPFEMMTATEQCFGLTLSTACPGWAFRMMDFIGYHEDRGAMSGSTARRRTLLGQSARMRVTAGRRCGGAPMNPRCYAIAQRPQDGKESARLAR